MDTLQKTAKEARLKVLDLIFKAQTSHIGSNFSCIDILTVLFSKFDWEKDKFVLSAGWKAASLYYFLWKYGRITEEELNSFCQVGSPYIGLAEPITKDIPISGGSMGLGLPGAVGLALAKKLQKEDGTVYCLMSDGELQVGTTWESALIASKHELDNLVVIIDCNKFQAMGTTESVLGGNYFPGTPFYRQNVDGHDFKDIERGLENEGNTGIEPLVIFAHTTKGKGVSFMENNNLFHYKAPNKDEYEKAKAELCQTS